MPYNIHHTAIAVSDLDRTLEDYAKNFKIHPISVETIDDQGVREAMIAVGGSHIQLLEPLLPDSPVGKFLSKHGEGLHHIAFAVTDIETALAHLQDQGVTLIDETPRLGGGGHRIAFVHPRDHNGTLIELVEVGDG
ncbi:MAG: methylmalonyl-CoA epimerase [Proteobacteria bacterium]|nr:methylmalonyl-CoA epimerase [Pseudomonadota bacterium]